MKSIVLLAKEAGCSKQEYAKKYFESQGCTLLDEYKHCMQPMRFLCQCGREARVNWNKFTTRNFRCGFCHETGRKRKYNIEEVRQLLKERSLELLQDEYKNTTTILKYRCKCGKESSASLASLIYQNTSCYDCGREKTKGPNNHTWITDRKMKAEKDSFRKRCYKLLRRCLSMVGSQKTSKTEVMLGYTIIEFRNHIKQHPNWAKIESQGLKWHVDHIFPLYAFWEHGIKDLTIINCLENLQPLTHSENDSKGNQYNKEEFERWLKTKNINI